MHEPEIDRCRSKATNENDNVDDPFTGPINFGARLEISNSRGEWCKCGRCMTMDNPLMNICCRELSELQDKLVMGKLVCICYHREFEMIVLEKAVLRTALVAMKDVKRASLVEPIIDRTFRLAAYRQFTWWCHTRLGKGVRRVIPSCVVKMIRERYPDPLGNYTGFREADENDNFYSD